MIAEVRDFRWTFELESTQTLTRNSSADVTAFSGAPVTRVAAVSITIAPEDRLRTGRPRSSRRSTSMNLDSFRTSNRVPVSRRARNPEPIKLRISSCYRRLLSCGLSMDASKVTIWICHPRAMVVVTDAILGEPPHLQHREGPANLTPADAAYGPFPGHLPNLPRSHRSPARLPPFAVDKFVGTHKSCKGQKPSPLRG